MKGSTVTINNINGSSGADAWKLPSGLVAPMVTKAICELKVPDILAQSDEPLTAAQILDRMSKDNMNGRDVAAVNHLGRMMRYLASQGVFTVHMSEEPGITPRYSLSSVSALLLSESSSSTAPSLRSLLLFQSSPAMVAMLQHFADLVTRGVTPCEAAHGTDLWGLSKFNPEFGRLFNSAMASASRVTMDALIAGYRGLDGLHGTFVDVGGGVGVNASRIVDRYPSSICAINFDQPHVVADAPAYPGVEHVGGDMFQFVPHGDIICLKWILHDWDDEDCIKILKNCHKALSKDGKLIIVESVLDFPNDMFPDESLGLDMLIMAMTKGKERCVDEWGALLHASGFLKYKIIGLPCPQCVIEAYPKKK